MRILAQFGMAVWLQILMCLVSLVFAGWYAWKGGMGRLRVLAALATASTFATLASVCMGLALVGRGVGKLASTGSANLVSNAFVGAGEAMAGGMMGFATLTLVATLAAIGLARDTAR
jgi:hypothetical protein